MLTKQERKTQKKVLEQRDEARAQIDSLNSEIERLKGDVRVVAGQEIAKAEAERDAAFHQREALLKDFEGAVAAKCAETQRELEATKAQLQTARKEVLGLVTRNSVQSEELANNRTTIGGFISTVKRLEAELALAKMEDAKALRKRLQAKTERVGELEKELARARAKPNIPVIEVKGKKATTGDGLTELLASKLSRQHRRLGQSPAEATSDAPATEAPPTQP